MPQPAVEPRSARLSWEEVHRLELLVRVRASRLATPVGSRMSCALCARPLGEAPMRLAGVLVHAGCLPSSAHAGSTGPRGR
jgi:hypothetical protein